MPVLSEKITLSGEVVDDSLIETVDVTNGLKKDGAIESVVLPSFDVRTREEFEFAKKAIYQGSNLRTN